MATNDGGTLVFGREIAKAKPFARAQSGRLDWHDGRSLREA